MIKIAKKYVIAVLIIVIASILGIFMRNIPVSSFSYQTSTVCNSNLYGGISDSEYISYRMIGGGLSEYRDKKAKLTSLQIPQDGCEAGLAPVDVTQVELFVL